MTKDIDWSLYRTFLAVMTEGSLSAAARVLGIAQPTVGRHISTLEASLKQVLFTRSQGGLQPTDTAYALRGYAAAMRNTATALERAAASQGAAVTGTVRISASEVIGVEVLPEMLARLCQQHPALKIELVPTDRIQDLLEREADIAVRMMCPTQGALIARRVGVVKVGLYARDDYLAAHGTPSTVEDLTRHALIGFDEETPFLRTAMQSLNFLTRQDFALRSDNNLAQLALVRAGCGIGGCPVKLAKNNPRLVRVLPYDWEFHLETWVAMHGSLRDNVSCRAVFDALVERLQAYMA